MTRTTIGAGLAFKASVPVQGVKAWAFQPAITRSATRCISCRQPQGQAHTASCRVAPFVPGATPVAFNVNVRTPDGQSANYLSISNDSVAAHAEAIDRFGPCAVAVRAARPAC